MKLLFAGTPGFAAIALDALIEAGFEIALVLTQPDRAAGRGMHARASAVKQLALARGLRVLQPAELKSIDVREVLGAAGAQFMVVAAYGLILPAEVLTLPARGCLNIHASLLPRWRGAAPIQRALIAGDRETGITIMQMDPGLDTGDILLQEKLLIGEEDTALSLHDKLAHLGARCIVQALTCSLEPRRQDNTMATYAPKIIKAEALIDWTCSAQQIRRQIRAFNPSPGAVTTLAGEPLKVWGAQPSPSGCAGKPGEILAVTAEGIIVATSDGSIALTELQAAGGKRVSAAAYLSGHRLAPGAHLGGHA